MTTRIAVAGCCGRMGQALVRLAQADPRFELVAILAHRADARLGESVARGLKISADCAVAAAPDVLIEFTNPAGCAQWARWCAERGVALVSGTTGLDAAAEDALAAAAGRVPVVWSANMGQGVNVLLDLVRRAAAALGPAWDADIHETHHRAKRDAPSGTARMLAQAVHDAWIKQSHDRAAPAVHSARVGTVVGEHVIQFAGPDETIVFQHRAHSRDVFARGALHAALWARGRAPGRYDMRDVLGLTGGASPPAPAPS